MQCFILKQKAQLKMILMENIDSEFSYFYMEGGHYIYQKGDYSLFYYLISFNNNEKDKIPFYFDIRVP
jgi:hypothetical protein